MQFIFYFGQISGQEKCRCGKSELARQPGANLLKLLSSFTDGEGK